MRGTIWICLSLAALLPATTIAAEDYQAGLDAYNAADYQRALQIWQPLADAGLAEAQFNIGLMYDLGKGVEPDAERAADWFQAAADGAYARAMFKLGDLYERGSGVEQSDILALGWFSLAQDLDAEGARKRRRKLAKRMTAYDIAQAELFAREWHRKRKDRS